MRGPADERKARTTVPGPSGPQPRLPLSPERLVRKHLRAAGGAKEDAVGEATHLVAATLFAGVAAEDLGEASYPPEIPQDIAIQVQPHRLQWAAEGSINFIRPSSQCGQTMRPGRGAGAAGALQHLSDDGHLRSRAPGHARCRRERHGRCPILGISHVSRRGPQGPASAARDDRPSLGALIERPFPKEED